MKFTDLDRTKMAKLLQDLAYASTYQFSDKRGEWGIEDSLVEDFGMEWPDEDSDDFDEKYDEMYDIVQTFCTEYENVFNAGLKALGYPVPEREEDE